MPLGYENSRFWKQSLAQFDGDQYARNREILRIAYYSFRERAAILAAEIPQDLHEFTVHDISHSDALWELASLVAGEAIDLTPTEAFVLGGAFLMHDLGMALAAFPNGIAGLRAGEDWKDFVAVAVSAEIGRSATIEEIDNPSAGATGAAIRAALRERHAATAASLPETRWVSKATGDEYRLIENLDLSGRYGRLIGELAASHGWSILEVASHFERSVPIGAPVDCPDEWTVDELKLACLLRLADAAHLDERRAPGFLATLRSPSGVASEHWTFQNHLQRVTRSADRLVFTSARPFKQSEADAWWTCFDALNMVDGELRAVDALLSDRRQLRFAATSVAGSTDPGRMSHFIRTDGWTPVDARLTVSNIPALVTTLGGSALYGEQPAVGLRELIQNARDATVAHRRYAPQTAGAVVVGLDCTDDGEYWLSVSDNGIGMSRAVITEVLLDFGHSYWGSQLMRAENPGLAASGFSPVGKYGIGFYSVFMLGDEVQVVSRRFDEASADTKVLEFSGGAFVRPILRAAARSEQMAAGGTQVRVRLREKPLSRKGLLGDERDWSDPNPPKALSQAEFAQFCASLAPTMDCDVYVRYMSEPDAPVVQANDWLALSELDLIRRMGIDDDEYPPLQSDTRLLSLESVAKRIQPVVSEGITVGRLTFAQHARYLLAGEPVSLRDSFVTIGGLRVFDRSSRYLTGCVQAEPSTATRNQFTTKPSFEAWSSWATDQANLWADDVNSEMLNGNSQFDVSVVVDGVCEFGGHPGPLWIAAGRFGGMSYDGIAAWAASRREIVCIDRDDSPRVWFDGQDEHLMLWNGDNNEECALENDSVLVALTSHISIAYSLLPDPYAPRPGGFMPAGPGLEQAMRDVHEWFFYAQYSVDGWILRAVAAAWGVDVIGVLDSLQINTRTDQLPRVRCGRTAKSGANFEVRPSWVLRRPV